MNLADFHFDLPPERIAQAPLADRAASRMLVVDRRSGTWQDRLFRDLPEYVGPGDTLVFNDSRVIPARLIGRRAGGGAAETLLVRPVSERPLRWEALVRPGKKLGAGERIAYDEGLEATVVERGEAGLRTLEFFPAEGFLARVERIGHIPLPPYIRRPDSAADRERYQTIFARQPGSAAAPTAGLHFTPEMLEAVRARGAATATVTLHVGLGTFQPIRADRIEEHRMHAERYEIVPEAAAAIAAASRVVAVGTTSARTLEHAVRVGGVRIEPGTGETDLFLYPGRELQAVGALLTNFHLPDSTLILLVAAFAGRELTLAAYRHAVAAEYRFYSYGDCMLIV